MVCQRAVITAFGQPEVIKVVTDSALPEPQPGEVRVRIEASSATFTDTLVRKGIYPLLRKTPPLTPGYDFIGRVHKLGAGVSGLTVGQRVANLTQIGSNTSYICVPAAELVPVPEAVDPAEAETLVLTYMTAYQMLHRMAHVQPGQRILVHGGTGSVGNALLQLGREMGLELVSTASHKNLPLLEQYGAVAIDYQAPDYDEQLHQAAGSGFHAAFDGVGLASFRRSFRLLRDNGSLVPYGFVRSARQVEQKNLLNSLVSGLMFAVGIAQIVWWNIVPNKRTVAFYDITGTRRKHPDWFREDLTHLFHLLETKRIQPLIHARYPLHEIVQAHAALDAGIQGRIVLVNDTDTANV